jgi:hypothetical protein
MVFPLAKRSGPEMILSQVVDSSSTWGDWYFVLVRGQLAERVPDRWVWCYTIGRWKNGPRYTD